MNAKHTIGLILMVWGGIGVVNQFFLVQASTGGQAPTAMLAGLDPSTILGVTSTTPGYTSAPMLLDAAILAGGAWLKWK